MPSNPLAMLQEFNKFRRSITPEGAKQRVQELLQSGRMSQQQFEQLQQQAQAFAQFLKLAGCATVYDKKLRREI